MVNVQTQIHIKRPRTDVADYAANPDNAPKWYVNIHKSQRLTTGPGGYRVQGGLHRQVPGPGAQLHV
jgi:hypothetical protein